LVGGIIAVLTPGVIAVLTPGVIAGEPGINAVPLFCCGIAVELVPGVIAVRDAPEAGAAPPEAGASDACAKVAVE
jgi:hypothetical protein